MSKSQKLTDDEMQKYRTTTGSEVKVADVSSDTHALKEVIGSKTQAKERKYDPSVAGERFVNFYDDSAAAIREYFSNAETACIRRARHELIEAGVPESDVPTNVSERIEMAEDVAGYEPLIEVTYNRQSDAVRLVIEDNGIGISVEEYQVLQQIGYSASHMNGEVTGQFGLGFMSGFQLVGINGTFRLYTRSFITDEAYSTAEYVANCEYLDGEPTAYGTRFEFPAFSEKAKQINIRQKVEDYAEGMQVPVLYREKDESGQECFNEDYLAHYLEDDYSDDSLVVTYEDDYFKAVMSPDNPTNRNTVTTYNVTMPIRRNDGSWGSSTGAFNAPWKFDFRAKKENGPIVNCESDPSVEGLVPIEKSKYMNMTEDQKEDHIPLPEVADDAISMPRPASSRDSYMSDNDTFWKYVSDCLNEEWAEIASETFQSINTWKDVVAMDSEQFSKLYQAYDKLGPGWGTTEPSEIKEALDEVFDVDLDEDICRRLHRLRRTVSVVPEGCDQAHLKSPLTNKNIYTLIAKHDDNVYIGKSVSQKKAEIAWGLGATVVRVDDTDKYDEYAEDWGWKLLKDLPSRNLGEKLDLPDDVLDKWDNTTNSNNKKYTSSGSSNPKQKWIKVRSGSGKSKYYSTIKSEDVFDALDNDESVSCGSYYSADKLVLKKQTNISSITHATRLANRSRDVAVAIVPNYVYEYLIEADKVYGTKKELVEDNADYMVDVNGSQEDIRDLNEDDAIVLATSTIRDKYDAEEVLATHTNTDKFSRVFYTTDIDDTWDANTDATVYKFSDYPSIDFSGYNYAGINDVDIEQAIVLENMDKDSEEYAVLFGDRYGKPSGDQFDVAVEIAKKADLL